MCLLMWKSYELEPQLRALERERALLSLMLAVEVPVHNFLISTFI